MIAKLGPFCSRDNCCLVRLVLEGGSPGTGLESAVLLEGVGAMGVARTVVGLEAVVEVLDILDSTFQCPLKVFWSMLPLFTVCLFRL